jgi:hypothetical protein
MLRSSLTPKRAAQPPRRVSLSGGRGDAPSKSLPSFSVLMKERTLDMAVEFVIAARKESAIGRIKRDTMFHLLKGMPPEYTRDMIYSRERKRRRVEKGILDTTNAVASGSISPTDDVPESVAALRNTRGRALGSTDAASISPTDDVPESVPALRNKGGRPLGYTDEAKRDREEREDMAKAEAAKALLALWAKRKQGGYSKQNELRCIIEAAKKKFNVEDCFISPKLVRDRATKGCVSIVSGSGRASPMLEIEPLLVTFVICMQRIGKPLNSTTFPELANSLIEGTPLEEQVLASKKGGKRGAANGERY